MSLEQKLKLFSEFYKLDEKSQGTYLLGLIQTVGIQRRRHGQYDSPAESRRQCTVFYQIPNNDGKLVQVCKKTFCAVFSLSDKKVYNLCLRKKSGEYVFKEKRGKKNKKYTEVNLQSVMQHIKSIPAEESHYGRAQSSKKYLSPDLNIHRLFHAFKKINPDSIVTYKYYRSVFKSRFPDLSFHRPRTDTCKTCDLLTCSINSNNKDGTLAKTKLQVHHLKYKAALRDMKNDHIACVLPSSDCTVISIDLQQVMFVPTLTHSEMFYKRQLSCYNFAVHVGDINKAYMCMWHEAVAARGADEITSCLLAVLNQCSVFHKEKLIIWSDNCAGQNKNRMMVFLLMFLVAHGHFKDITQKFLVSGHSFLSCDRDFAVIEKRKRNTKAFIPSELHDIVRTSRHENPFEVIDMDEKGIFFAIQAAADTLINTKTLNISKATGIRVTEPLLRDGCISVKTCNGVEDWMKMKVMKKGKNLDDIKGITLQAKEKNILINRDKRKNLMEMLPYLKKEEYKKFYENLP